MITVVGLGFFKVLTILFIGLKLTGYIHWNWFFVLMPATIPFVSFVLFLILLFLMPNKAGNNRKEDE